MREQIKKKIAAAIAIIVVSTTLSAPFEAGRKPNFGLYVSHYQKVVGTNSPLLEHPTGEYVSIDDYKWKHARELYTPQLEYTDDMDSTVMEMREKGYVMIGYAAFNSTEAQDSPFHDGMTQGERTGTKIGLKMRGYDPNMDMKGDPTHAAIWANAAVVAVQKGYAFSRIETKRQRIRTDQGKESTTWAGRRSERNRGLYAGGSSGSSSTNGSSNSKGKWDEEGKEVSVGADAEGPSAEAGANWSEGTNSDRTKYNERTTYNDRYAGGSMSASDSAYRDQIDTRTEHWATTLMDKHVNHYDYMVTYWKKAKVDKFVFGAFTENVPRETMNQIGTRHARLINAVVGGTPAYDADIWEGDVLLEIAGEPVRGEQGYSDLLTEHAGQEIEFTIWRDGEVYDVPVRLNSPSR